MTLSKTLHAGAEEGKETIAFYHISTEVDALKSFFRKGAKAIGKGLGGQQDGFYVWTNEKEAEKHACSLNDNKNGWMNKSLKNGEAMMIETCIPKANIHYPLWQFDLEVSKELNPLLFKYKDQISNIKNLEYQDSDGQKQTIRSVIISRMATKEDCPIVLRPFKGCDSACRKIGSDNTDWLDVLQALIDKMCENQNFKKDYNKLLQESISSSSRLALKYTGTDSLAISKADYIKINTDGSITKTTIFDTSKGGNQVCPFLTLGITRTRKEK